jgi:hypothetical protein
MLQLSENSQPATELIKHAQRVATIAKLATVFFLLAGIVITGSCFLNFQHLTKASDDALTLSQNLKAASLDATSRKQDADAAATASGDAVNISKSNYDGIAPFRYFTPDLFSSLHIAPVSAAQVDSAWQAYSDAKVSNTNDEAAAVTANTNFSNAQAASIGASGESAAAFRTAGRAWSATAYAGIYSALVGSRPA